MLLRLESPRNESTTTIKIMVVNGEMTELAYVSSSNGEFSGFDSQFPYQIKRPPKRERDKLLRSAGPIKLVLSWENAFRYLGKIQEWD